MATSGNSYESYMLKAASRKHQLWMLIATNNGFTGFEQSIRSRLIVKLLHEHHYEKDYFNSVKGAIAPIAPMDPPLNSYVQFDVIIG